MPATKFLGAGFRQVFFLTVFLSGLMCTEAAAERQSVGADIANIRSGPGTNHEILWKVEKYYPVFVIKKEGEWVQFRDFEGDIGWVHSSLLQKTSSVITKAPKCNVREGPGTRFRVVFSVTDGIPFRVLKRKGSWIQIRHTDGDTGWIHQSLVW